jgi:hypothetical protein
MKKIILLLVVLTFGLSNLVSAEEQKCKKFDVFCKSKEGVKNFFKSTKEFQKKGLEKSADQIKNTLPK